MNFKNLRLWVFLFGTIFLIAAFLFQQSKENKKQLQLQSMKSIELTKQNFLETFDNYHNQLDSYLRRYFYSKIFDEDPSHPASKMVKIFDRQERFKILSVSLVNDEELRGKPYVESQIEIHPSDSTFIIEKNHLFHLDAGEQTNTTIPQLQKLLTSLRRDPNFVFKDNMPKPGKSTTFRIVHAIDLYELMKHNLNDDFFDAIYIADSAGSILFPSKNIGMDLFQPFLVNGNTESANNSGAGGDVNTLSHVGNRHFRLNISSVDQEVFVSKFNLGTRELYLIGAKNSDHFRKVALRIDFNLLSAFVLGLLFILVSIPIISLVKLDTGDVLSRAKVYGVGFSLIVIFLLLGFTISYIRHEIHPEHYDQKINRVRKQFIDQIAPFKNILEGKDSIDRDTIALTNEFLTFDDKGMITEMKFNQLRDTLQFSQPFVSIANRDYVLELFRENAFKRPFFISAHYSQSTGRQEGVISKKTTDTTGIAVTFKLDPLLKDSMARFFVFKAKGKILFNSEKITIPVNNLEEAVGTKKWMEIQTLIQNNQEKPDGKTVWAMPLYVNGYEYEGKLSEIKTGLFDQSLWVLYLVDHNLQHSMTSLTAIEASGFFLIYFSFLILLSLLNALANKQSIYLNIKSFSYSWFGPSPGKKNRYLLLNFILVVDVFGLILIYNLVKMDIFAVLLSSCLFAIHASLCKFILIYPKPQQRMHHKGLIFIIPCSLLLITNLYILCGYLVWGPRPVPFYIFLVLILMVAFLAWICMMEFTKMRDSTSKINRSLLKTYNRIFLPRGGRISTNGGKFLFAISFTLWALLIGFIPGYVIHRSISHHEDYIWRSGAVMEDKSRDMNEKFERLLAGYEQIRRAAFIEVTDQYDAKINNFLSPDFNVIKNSFARESVYVIPEKNSSNRSAADLLTQQPGTFQIGQLIGICLLLILLFLLVIFLTDRIYLTEYLFTKNNYRLPVTGKPTQKNFVVCIDNLAALDWIYSEFNLGQDEVYLHDFIEHPTIEDLSNLDPEKVPVFLNFHCAKDFFGLNTPLLHLFNAYQKKNKAIFITSGSSLKQLISTTGEPNAKLAFSEIFADFMSYIVPINFQKERVSLPFLPTEKSALAGNGFQQMAGSLLFEDRKVRLLEKELNYGPNSWQTAAILTEEISNDPMENKMSRSRFEKCLLTIQRHNKGFYINLWNELSQPERKMVYYYAREGFINYSNRDTLTELIQKGIFTLNAYEEGLVLFSKSFRNFVTLLVTEKEILQFKEDERMHGNVANIRTAAFSFIFLSIAIISYYDPSVLNKTSAYVSGIIGLIGTITSFLSKGFGSFGWGKKEEKA